MTSIPMIRMTNPITDNSLHSFEYEAWVKRLFPRGKISRVLLVNPPDGDSSIFQYDVAKRFRYPNYPPYGLAIIAHNLRKVGIEARITNLNHEVLKRCVQSSCKSEFDFDTTWQQKLDAEISEFFPDFVGVTCMFTLTHTSFKKVCLRVKYLNHPLAVGGVHVTNDVERILDDIPGVDIAFLNEADIAVQRFVQVINNERHLEDLSQVVITDGSTRYHFTGQLQPSSADISSLPAFDLLDMSEHSDFGTVGAFYCFKPKGTRFATVLSNRGCRAECTFCSVRNFNGIGVRHRTIESVIQEIQILKNEYGIGHIMWLDDDLLKDNRRAISLFNEMVRRKLDVTWDATNGLIAGSCTDEVIAAAAESGCIAVNIGMESGNPNVLRQIRKPGAVKNFLRAAAVLRKYEQIHSSVLLMLGFPGETMSMVLDTINVAREMDLDWYRISQLQPLPNTPIYDSMVAEGLIQAVGSKNVRFNGGAYGKQTEIEQGRQMSSLHFEEAFSSIRHDEIPTADQLTDVWFYMNYHLNFHRLFSETRPIKIGQQIKHLRNLCDVISPENGFALYFLGYLQYKTIGEIDQDTVDRLRKRLSTSAYWQDRFSAFGLSIDDLVMRNFKNKDIPRLIPEKLSKENFCDFVK